MFFEVLVYKNLQFFENAEGYSFSGSLTNCVLGHNFSGITHQQTNDLIQDTDLLFIVKSPQWVPEIYDKFFNELLNKYEKKTNIKPIVDKRWFCNKGEQKPYTK